MRKSTFFTLVLIGLWFSPLANAEQVRPGEGVEFSQVDWTFPGAEQIDSFHGLFAVDFERLARSTEIRRGYLNVATLEGWVVRNLPLLPDLRCGGLSTLFDLAATAT